MEPKQAILIQQPWVQMIFHPDPEKRKTWEIRSFDTCKRGLFAIAVVGAKRLAGQVELVKTIQVAERKEHGGLGPVGMDEENYLMEQRNWRKAGFDYAPYPDYLKKKDKLFAWEFANAQEYDPPRKWRHKNGAVVFANINDEKKDKKKVSGQTKRPAVKVNKVKKTLPANAKVKGVKKIN